MELQTHDLRELAEFFAKRFPRTNDRRLLVDQIRLPHKEEEGKAPIQAWMAMLEVARNRRALTQLGEAAQRLRPYDENLSSMTDVLRRSEGGGARGGLQMVGMAMAALLAVGSTWAAINSLEQEASDETEAAEASVDNPANTETASLFDNPPTETTAIDDTPSFTVPTMEAAMTETSEFAAVVENTEMNPSPRSQKKATQRERPRSVVDTGSAYHNGRCTTEDDGVVGYWYAGADAPGQAGEVLVMDYSVNVRADYPDHHNAYDARAAVRCQLAAGDKVRLTAPPIHVPGDAYWVPLYNGDLIKGDA